MVPKGQVWVLERFGKPTRATTKSLEFLLPFVDTVKTVKSEFTVSCGHVSKSIKTSNGATVDAYAVSYIDVVDPLKVTIK